jgi:SAM-dependent methyltransferase
MAIPSKTCQMTVIMGRMVSEARLQFISLSDQQVLSEMELARGMGAAEKVSEFLQNRETRIKQLGLDPAIWLPAANWGGDQAFYESSRRLMRGENIEWLRLFAQQFTGYALWSLRRAGPLPPDDIVAIERTILQCSSSPDQSALELCQRLRVLLPEHLRMGPPRKLGEIGWMVEDVIVNHDTAAYWERLLLLYRYGFLDPQSDQRLRTGSRILEIGAGYGALAYYIQRAVPGVEYTIVDIPESLIYSAVYVSILNPDASIRILPNYEFPVLVDNDERFDLVINTLSMSEMSDGQVRAYSEGVKHLIGESGVFFEQNQDNRHIGFLNARDILGEYFSNQHILDDPDLKPHLTQGIATVWSN